MEKFVKNTFSDVSTTLVKGFDFISFFESIYSNT